MRWVDAHREAMVAAADTHEELELDTFERIDVFDALPRLGLKLMFRPLQGCAALYLPAALGGRPGAIVHAGHPLATQRYSAGHEGGHHVFDHGGQIDRDTEPRLTGRELGPFEKLAEAFAAWFLMPPEAAETAMGRLGLAAIVTPVDAYALSLRLGTSYQATCVHLPSLKLLKGPVADEWMKARLRDVKQELSDDPPPGGWRNDVWAVTAADAAAVLVVRAGDRLLFDRAGATVAELPAGATCTVLAGRTLLEPPRLCVDLRDGVDAGPAMITLQDAGETVTFSLAVERPRLGRFVPAAAVAR